MKYSIDYQYMRKGANRPSDDGQIVGIEANDKSGVVILPNVGDYVHIPAMREGQVGFDGIVKSRLFSYFRIDDAGEDLCNVNIVVAETDDNVWPTLIKE
ncbi:hypothetical protein ACRZ5S_14530 [Vibrio scophthalmi]|uniref:hypothetical protein n=1 Tax=Vibrio scophthalmi TaxID=45658 RepID=UPI003EBE00B0